MIALVFAIFFAIFREASYAADMISCRDAAMLPTPHDFIFFFTMAITAFALPFACEVTILVFADDAAFAAGDSGPPGVAPPSGEV